MSTPAPSAARSDARVLSLALPTSAPIVVLALAALAIVGGATTDDGGILPAIIAAISLLVFPLIPLLVVPLIPRDFSDEEWESTLGRSLTPREQRALDRQRRRRMPANEPPTIHAHDGIRVLRLGLKFFRRQSCNDSGRHRRSAHGGKTSCHAGSRRSASSSRSAGGGSSGDDPPDDDPDGLETPDAIRAEIGGRI